LSPEYIVKKIEIVDLNLGASELTNSKSSLEFSNIPLNKSGLLSRNLQIHGARLRKNISMDLRRDNSVGSLGSGIMFGSDDEEDETENSSESSSKNKLFSKYDSTAATATKDGNVITSCDNRLGLENL
jgi:hypothetical protein